MSFNRLFFYQHCTILINNKCVMDAVSPMSFCEGSKSRRDYDIISLQSNKQSMSLKLPEEPTTCCMSGCANCVWLDYADTISRYYQDGGEKAIREIDKKIADPNIKAYLLHEIRMRNK